MELTDVQTHIYTASAWATPLISAGSALAGALLGSITSFWVNKRNIAAGAENLKMQLGAAEINLQKQLDSAAETARAQRQIDTELEWRRLRLEPYAQFRSCAHRAFIMLSESMDGTPGHGKLEEIENFLATDLAEKESMVAICSPIVGPHGFRAAKALKSWLNAMQDMSVSADRSKLKEGANEMLAEFTRAARAEVQGEADGSNPGSRESS